MIWSGRRVNRVRPRQKFSSEKAANRIANGGKYSANRFQRAFISNSAVDEIKSHVTGEHPDQRHVIIDDEFSRVVWVPFLAHLGCESAGRNLHSRMLVKQIEVVRKIRIYHQTERHASCCKH